MLTFKTALQRLIDEHECTACPNIKKGKFHSSDCLETCEFRQTCDKMTDLMDIFDAYELHKATPDDLPNHLEPVLVYYNINNEVIVHEGKYDYENRQWIVNSEAVDEKHIVVWRHIIPYSLLRR